MIARNAKHQAAVDKAAEKVISLRADIHAQLAVVRRLNTQLEDLTDTRQSVGMPFQTPAARELADKQARADRLAARTPNSVPPSGPVPAPVTMPAVSASAEILFTLQHHVRRLARAALLVALEAEQTEIEDAGVCTWPRRAIVVTPPKTDADVDELAEHLGRLVDGYTRRPGLQALLRDLEHLEDSALTVLDGVPAKEPAPRPTCPWCGRDTLALIHREKRDDDTGLQPVEVIRCEGTHECRCNRAMCPCQSPRGRRHEWHRAAGAADTWTQLASLQNKHQELTAMETKALDAVNRALQLHEEIGVFVWASDCPTPTEHEPDWIEPVNGAAELICTACPAITSVCSTCRDEDGQPLPWPCPTAEALDINHPTHTETEI